MSRKDNNESDGKEAGTYNGIDDTEIFTLEIELFAPMV